MIVWDTGPLFAAADADDRDHGRCVELMRRTPPPLCGAPSSPPGVHASAFSPRLEETRSRAFDSFRATRAEDSFG